LESVGFLHGQGLRLQDAWSTNDDVRAIALNARVLEMLGKLYGRRAIPFQTVNFPVGTQQHYHSDSVHFSSIPERYMCGVWVALENIDEDNGPLVYFPDSHQWPIYSNEHTGKIIKKGDNSSQQAFEDLWEKLVRVHNLKPKRFLAKKGQAAIWLANLLHGGDKQNSAGRTRWSQATHYFFEDCAYYAPMASIW
jgi:ectoine hydroxylase-related dioxygenase (phytanoyl-CoA dioxygenase family)